MTSSAQAEANRRNAQNSTGPKTQEGKAASRLNALKHGLTAKQLVLFDETDAQTAPPDDVARARLDLTRDTAQQRGLARAIAGDQSDSVSRIDGEIEIAEQRPR